MKINHIALYVNDIEKSRQFFERYFGAVSGNIYHNRKTGFSSYFLSFDDDTRIEIMHHERFSHGAESQYHIGYAHIAFSVGSKENVDLLTLKLKDDEYCIAGEPRTTGDGYYESCIIDSEGNRIEITI